ncbi:MAG: hypothetical protein ABI967_13970 [bacterium]
MKEAEAKTNSSRTRREAISKSLNESMPSMDHEPILEFLKNDEALPRKFTGTALQTHYIAYERGIQARSISQYKVGILRRQRWLEKVTASGQEILTKEKIKALVEGVTDDWAGELGMAAGKGVASLEITNSTLIWKEFSVD